tara:strand:- start:314 stop:700 length:387 start_codon:yes stop_codon:yes gene_type:complete
MRTSLVGILFLVDLVFPDPSYTSHVELKPCIEIKFCAIAEWDVKAISEPLNEVKAIIKNIPGTEIVKNDGDYVHAEVVSKNMEFVDDLEVSYSPDTKKLVIRSESREGKGVFGVNQKRVDSIKTALLF